MKSAAVIDIICIHITSINGKHLSYFVKLKLQLIFNDLVGGPHETDSFNSIFSGSSVAGPLITLPSFVNLEP